MRIVGLEPPAAAPRESSDLDRALYLKNSRGGNSLAAPASSPSLYTIQPARAGAPPGSPFRNSTG
jgi:hypothetical protein